MTQFDPSLESFGTWEAKESEASFVVVIVWLVVDLEAMSRAHNLKAEDRGQSTTLR
jgi:hypothetical protein